MAKLLYRLGKFSAHRAVAVIAAWIAILALAGVAYFFGHGTLVETVSIPGTKTMQVADEVAKNIPQFGGGSGTIVYSTSDGKPFTSEQKASIASQLRTVSTYEGINTTVNPFDAQQQKNDKAQEITNGERQIRDATSTLETNQKQIDDGNKQVSDGEQQLALAKQQAQSGQETINQNAEKLATGQQEINEQEETLTSAQQEINVAQQQLDANLQKVNEGLDELARQQKTITENTTTLEKAKQQLDTAQEQLDSAKAQLDSAQQQVQQSQQLLDTLEHNTNSIAEGLAGVRQQMEAAQCPTDETQGENPTCPQLRKQQASLQASLAQLIDSVHATDPSVQDETSLRTYIETQHQKLDAAQEQIASQLTQLQYEQRTEEIAQARKQLDYDANMSKLNAGQQQLDAAKEQLNEGQRQIIAGQATLDSKKQQLAIGIGQLDAGKQQIASGTAQLNEAQEQLNAAYSTISQNEQKLAQTKTSLLEGQQKINSAKIEIASKQAQLNDGRDLLALAKDINFVSTDNSTALGMVQFRDSTLSVQPELKQAVMNEIRKTLPAGVQVEFASDISRSIPTISSTEIIGVIVAALVLFIMLGTLLAVGLPLLSALIGVGVGSLAALAFSTTVSMMSITPVLGLMLGLAVGIDYSLFILNRHRRQLMQGMEMKHSIALATGTSGSAVVFAGSTVVIALIALNVTGIPFLGVMGDTAALCVLTAVLVSVTFTPALLSLLGKHLLPKRKRNDNPSSSQPHMVTRPMSTVRSILTLVAGLTVLSVIAMPSLQMRLGIPEGDAEPVYTTQYKAYKTIQREFGDGTNSPLIVAASLPTKISSDHVVSTELAIARKISTVAHVRSVAPVGISQANDFIVFQVYPTTGPASADTEQLVHALRNLSPVALTVPGQNDLGNEITVFSGKVTLGVAGNASMNIDMSEKLGSVLPLYLAIIIGLSFVILMAVFRSVLVPLLAAFGFMLSVLATFGSVTAIFQWGWFGAIFGIHDPGPVLSFLPVLLIGILFGLAMDYQLFLVSGMREAFVRGSESRLAVAQGFHAGRSVVIAAAIIMVSVFMGFVGSESVTIKSLGFGLALGVFFDAFIVRLLIVPAAMHLMGRAAWWFPRFLERLLPHFDVEGDSLHDANALS